MTGVVQLAMYDQECMVIIQWYWYRIKVHVVQL